jgi:outer membrane biosynthesis protein TonB
MENKIFYYAVLGSFLVHAVFIAAFSFQKQKRAKKMSSSMEVIYQKIKPQQPEKPVSEVKNIQVVKDEPEIDEKVEILPQNRDMSSLMKTHIKDMTKLGRDFQLEKRPMKKISRLDDRGKIKIPLLRSEKITNVRYLTYNQNIREKIKQKAYEYIDHPDFKEGEVYLTFILDASGFLKRIKVIEANTQANAYLKDIGIRCIKESSPFPPFPEDLNYPELTFNVIISFEVQGL